MTIRAERSARWLDVVVHDDGRGLPEGFSLENSDRLGLQIVRTLVSAELDGTLGMQDAPDRGTDVVLRVPIGRRTAIAAAVAAARQRCGPDVRRGRTLRDAGLYPAAGLRPGVATLQCTPLVFAHAAPDARVLAGVQGPTGTLWSPDTDYRPVSRQRSARAPGRCSLPGRTAPGPRHDRPPCGANPYVVTPHCVRSNGARAIFFGC